VNNRFDSTSPWGESIRRQKWLVSSSAPPRCRAFRIHLITSNNSTCICRNKYEITSHHLQNMTITSRGTPLPSFSFVTRKTDALCIQNCVKWTQKHIWCLGNRQIIFVLQWKTLMKWIAKKSSLKKKKETYYNKEKRLVNMGNFF
jgi:hypothetical protein